MGLFPSQALISSPSSGEENWIKEMIRKRVWDMSTGLVEDEAGLVFLAVFFTLVWLISLVAEWLFEWLTE